MVSKKGLLFPVFILICVSFTGCYTYKNISLEDYVNENNHSSTKIILKNKKEILVNKPDSLFFNIDEKKLIIRREKIDSVICLNDIAWIRESKYDYISTCIAGGLVGATGIFLTLVLVGLVILCIWGPFKI